MKITLQAPIQRKSITEKEISVFRIDILNKMSTVRFNLQTEDREVVSTEELHIDYSQFTKKDLDTIEEILVRVATSSEQNRNVPPQKI